MQPIALTQTPRSPAQKQAPSSLLSANFPDERTGIFDPLLAKVLNINVVVLVFIEMLVRFSYLQTNSDETISFTLTSVLGLPCLLAILVCAVFRMSPTLFQYCKFLDTKVGLGLYQILLALIILEKQTVYEVTFGVAIILVGIFNVSISIA
jgi:hypothetical protein